MGRFLSIKGAFSRWKVGSTTIDDALADVQLNAAIDAARFAKPMPAPPLKVQ